MHLCFHLPVVGIKFCTMHSPEDDQSTLIETSSCNLIKREFSPGVTANSLYKQYVHVCTCLSFLL